MWIYKLCAPVYRDAIIFYDEAGNIISTLNVCLGCINMTTRTPYNIKADYKVYDYLRQWFRAIGHEVEDQERWMIKDIAEAKKNSLKNKVRDR